MYNILYRPMFVLMIGKQDIRIVEKRLGNCILMYTLKPRGCYISIHQIRPPSSSITVEMLPNGQPCPSLGLLRARPFKVEGHDLAYASPSSFLGKPLHFTYFPPISVNLRITLLI